MFHGDYAVRLRDGTSWELTSARRSYRNKLGDLSLVRLPGRVSSGADAIDVERVRLNSALRFRPTPR